MDIVRRETPSTELGFGRDIDPFRDPFRMMRELLRYEPFRDIGGYDLGRLRTYTPRFDVRETKDCYTFEADLPGLRESDVQVSVTGNRLNVCGERTQQNVEEGENWYAAERNYGQFSRTFVLPDGCDVDSIKADMHDGVLRLTVPKRPEIQPRRINVGSGGTYEASGRSGNVGNQGNLGNQGNVGKQGRVQ